jgi:elongation factor G
MEKYVEGLEPEIEAIKTAIRSSTIKNELFPVFCGSALKNKGVQPLLDGIVDYLPSPRDVMAVKGNNPMRDDEIITREANDKEPFCALVFKIRSDPYVGKLSYVRVYSGSIKVGDTILNVSQNKKERIGRILRMHADDREDIKELYTGDIVALVGLKSVRTGDTLANTGAPILLEKMEFPEPVIAIAIEPRTKADQDKLNSALKRLEDEDPTFKVKVDSETGQNIIAGMGELHLEIIIDRMLREFKVQANVGKPQVAYKETITKRVESEYKYEKEIGGKNQYGHVIIELEPVKPGSGLIFENRLDGNEIPEEFISHVKEGIVDGMAAGILAGYEMVDIKVLLIGGSYDENDSVDLAYRIAANLALKEGVRKAEPALLEPIMKLEVVEYTGDVINDINTKRGKLEKLDMLGKLRVIDAYVPLAEVFGYATSVRSLSQGRASHTLQFSHYDVVPRDITDTIVGRIIGRIN